MTSRKSPQVVQKDGSNDTVVSGTATTSAKLPDVVGETDVPSFDTTQCQVQPRFTGVRTRRGHQLAPVQCETSDQQGSSLVTSESTSVNYSSESDSDANCTSVKKATVKLEGNPNVNDEASIVTESCKDDNADSTCDSSMEKWQTCQQSTSERESEGLDVGETVTTVDGDVGVTTKDG